MVWAGFWQLGRAEEKNAIKQKLSEGQIKQPLTPMDWRAMTAFETTAVTGRYHNMHFLLDNQIVDGRVGFFVLTAFNTENELWLLVNRGWHAEDDTDFNVSSQSVNLNGLVGNWPRPGIQLGDQEIVDSAIQHVTYLPQKPVMSMIKQRLCSQPAVNDCIILPWVLKLNPKEKFGFIRKWQLPRMTAEKHRGYAVQWFTMSLVLCVIYAIFLRKVYASKNKK